MNRTAIVKSRGARVAGGLAAGLWLSGVALAGFVPGGGKPASDCYLGFEVTGVTSSTGRAECVEGEACDVGECGDSKCTFELAVCVNQLGVPGCTPPSGGLASVKTPGPFKAGIPAPPWSGPMCGLPLTLDVKLKDHGKRGNGRTVRPRASAAAGTNPRQDRDAFNFVCVPRTTPCAPSTTTTTTTTSTTTTTTGSTRGAFLQ